VYELGWKSAGIRCNNINLKQFVEPQLNVQHFFNLHD